MCKLPRGEELMGNIIKNTFKKALDSEHGTRHWLDNNMGDHIEAYWGSRKAWEALPEKVSEMEHFTDWDKVIRLDHGYDKTKPESELTREDMARAAEFRGGKLISAEMETGATGAPSWTSSALLDTASRPARGWFWRVDTGVTSVNAGAGTMAGAPRSILSSPKSGTRSTGKTSCGNTPRKFLSWMFKVCTAKA